jgi:hypothetical protein
MTEKQLISQLKKLREVKPNQDWVALTKNQIFEESPASSKVGLSQKLDAFFEELKMGERFLFNHKLAFSSALLMVIFVGLFGFAQNSVPGSSLFAIRKITEQGQAVFTIDKTKYEFELAGKRLNDLNKIAKANNIENLAPALIEYNETVTKAAERLAEKEDIREVADEVRTLKEKETEVRSYGVELEENVELDAALKEIVEREIVLLKEKDIDIGEIEDLYNNKEYSEALEKILMLQK